VSARIPRHRVCAALHDEIPDLVPRFETWIEALLSELGYADPAAAADGVDQDCVMLPSQMQPGSNAWGTGIDEWGRVWQGGSFVGGAVDTDEDLRRYEPALTLVDQRIGCVASQEYLGLVERYHFGSIYA